MHVTEPLVARGGRSVVAFTHRGEPEPPNPLSRQLREVGGKDTGLDEIGFRELFHGEWERVRGEEGGVPLGFAIKTQAYFLSSTSFVRSQGNG